MRCIEIEFNIQPLAAKPEINRNMRCIEIYKQIGLNYGA